MPRIRTIKPQFFSSLTVAELPVEARLTFIGLWTHVDDAGRCVDDARLVKAAVWPLDPRDADDVEQDLRLLADLGLVLRYTNGRRSYLQVTGWAEHQYINRPSKSTIPAPDEPSLRAHGDLREGSAQERNKEKEKEQGTGKGTGNREGESEGEGADAPSPATPAPALATPDVVVELWNMVCREVLPQVRSLTDGRRRKVRARAVNGDEVRESDWWRQYFERIRASPFLCGDNDRGWRADFDWAVRSEEVVARVFEGRYDRKQQGPFKSKGLNALYEMAQEAAGGPG